VTTRSPEAIVVLGGNLTPEGRLAERGRQRMDLASELWKCGVAPFIVPTGKCQVNFAGSLTKTESGLYIDRGVKRGVYPDAFIPEAEALCTYGNGYYTKTNVCIPRGWLSFVVVTSKIHVPRAKTVFGHMYGPDYDIEVVAAPGEPTLAEIVHEQRCMEEAEGIFAVTDPGDHEAIWAKVLGLPHYNQLAAAA
jgi:uncharacterized SAM-binding protein YcdF (DUF218 family)